MIYVGSNEPHRHGKRKVIEVILFFQGMLGMLGVNYYIINKMWVDMLDDNNNTYGKHLLL